MLSGGQNYFSGNDGKPEVLFLKVKMDLIYSKNVCFYPKERDLIMWFCPLRLHCGNVLRNCTRIKIAYVLVIGSPSIESEGKVLLQYII